MKSFDIYRKIPQKEIPWDVETPPVELVTLIEKVTVKPCKIIDMGCGTGNYSIYLAQQGYDVTGIDLSATAIKMAKQKANKKKVQCNFLVADVLDDLAEINQHFDFAFDWGMLHHIFPEQRKKYAENVYRIISDNGKYLSVCFSEEDSHFGGKDKYRKTQFDNVLYFSSEKEMKKLFEKYFEIIELKTIEIKGKFQSHLAIYVYMTKKADKF